MHPKQVAFNLDDLAVKDKLQGVKLPKPDTTPSPVHDYGKPGDKPLRDSNG